MSDFTLGADIGLSINSARVRTEEYNDVPQWMPGLRLGGNSTIYLFDDNTLGINLDIAGTVTSNNYFTQSTAEVSASLRHCLNNKICVDWLTVGGVGTFTWNLDLEGNDLDKQGGFFINIADFTVPMSDSSSLTVGLLGLSTLFSGGDRTLLPHSFASITWGTVDSNFKDEKVISTLEDASKKFFRSDIGQKIFKAQTVLRQMAGLDKKNGKDWFDLIAEKDDVDPTVAELDKIKNLLWAFEKIEKWRLMPLNNLKFDPNVPSPMEACIHLFNEGVDVAMESEVSVRIAVNAKKEGMKLLALISINITKRLESSLERIKKIGKELESDPKLTEEKFKKYDSVVQSLKARVEQLEMSPLIRGVGDSEIDKTTEKLSGRISIVKELTTCLSEGDHCEQGVPVSTLRKKLESIKKEPNGK